ncbi:MAG TPA: SRPBCC family protein [Puia sp.]
MSSNSVTLHLVLKASPAKVFRAFSDADAYASWLQPYGYICKVHQMDFKIGGSYKMASINFDTGTSHSFGGKFLEIRNNEFIKHTVQFDDPHMPGETMTTIELKAVICGTDITIVQTAIPVAIPTALCYLGWQDSLEKLKRLVEPNIPEDIDAAFL